MRVLYYDCFAGIAGDMHLAALLDLGVDMGYLESELKKLNLTGYEISAERDSRNGIEGCKVIVNLTDNNNHSQTAGPHTHLGGNHNHHIHRSISDIEKIISKSKLSGKVKENSLKIFNRLAVAEAKVHGIPVEKVHFHEVGAIDAIVDIVGAAICIDYLKPDKIMASPVQLGGGFVKCAHGVFPVPAPATAELLTGIPVKIGIVDFESTTPTGAAILAAMVDEFTSKINFTIEKTAYGIGHRESEIPNVLRVYIGELEQTATISESAIIIESNIDDMNPEMYDYIIDKLFDLGADDVFMTSIMMKKARPAVKLSILTKIQNEPAIVRFVLEESTTLGIRKYEVKKEMLSRIIETIQTPYGEVRIKKAYYNQTAYKSKPEYDDCLKISRENQIPLARVYKMVEEMMRNLDNE